MRKTINQLPDKKTEEVILDAARKVFTAKGFAASRMEDIAKEAGMNRALLHYYYRSKQKMFDLIFEENLSMFYENFLRILSSDDSIENKIRTLVETEIDMLLQNQDLPLFILNEITHHPALIKEKIKNIPATKFLNEFAQQLLKEMRKGHIKQFDPMQLIMNMMSLCIFPFIGKPMMMAISGVEQKQFELLMKQRKKVVADILVASIKK